MFPEIDEGLHGTTTVKGTATFKVPAKDFIISPLTADADLHLKSIVGSVPNDKVVDTISSGEYTKVTGSIPYIEYYVNTSDTFYVKW